MTPSQLIAWLVCLVLAFFAAALAVSNSYKAAILERRFETVRHSAQEQTEVLARIEQVLVRIEEHLARPAPSEQTAEPAPAPAPAPPAAP